MHPTTPELDPAMRTALLLSVAALSAGAILVTAVRRDQLDMDEQLRQVELDEAD
jgi:hypothetical protein